MDTKPCFKCGVSKTLSDFYRHPKMADGHLGKCKDCTKAYVRKNRSENIEYYKKYDQMRFQRNDKRRLANRARSNTPEGKQIHKLSCLRWKTKNPQKRAAHVILGHAVRDGKIAKPLSCERCHCTPKPRHLHGHHHDYTLPLQVEWICVWCHAAEHFPNEYREIMK